MKLKDVTLSIFDGKHGDCKDKKGSGLYFISVKDLREHDIDYSNAREIDEIDFEQNYKRTNLEEGDTIYANTGDTIGKSVFVKDNPLVLKTSFQKSVAIVKPDTSVVEPRYLYYLLKSETPRLRKAATGSGQKNLLLSTMRDFDVSIFERDVQKKVSKVLGFIDDKIKVNNAINDNLQQMVYQTYMHMFFGKKPNGLLKDFLVENEKSRIPVGDAKGKQGIYPFFTSGDAVYRWNDALCDGRFIFLNTGGNADVKFYVGKSSYSTDTWCISFKNNLTEYMYLVLLSMKEELNKKYFQGTGLKHLQKPQLFKMAVYLPSNDELSVFNNIVVNPLETISHNYQENESLKNMRNYLLPLLMNGQITIAD